jgi:hypothetical protein
MRTTALLLIAGLAAACQRREAPAPTVETPPAPPPVTPPTIPAPSDPPPPPLENLRVALATEAAFTSLGPGGAEIVRRPWIGPFVQVLVEDSPDDPVPLRRARVASLSTDPSTLFARGLDNLRQSSPQPIKERTVDVAKSRVRITQFGGNYTAARLLLADLWSKIAAENAGRLWVAAPVRDVVLWTTSPAKDDQRALRVQARNVFQSRSFPISPAILRWSGPGWALEDANPVPAP